MFAVAVNVTVLPWQDGLAEAIMETLTVRLGLTVILIWLEIAGLPIAQVMLEVNMHFTKSPFVGI